MAHALDKVLLKPGAVVTFEDRDDLFATLDRLEQLVPARHEGRSEVHRQHFSMYRYLWFVGVAGLLRFPVTLKVARRGEDPPDFVLKWPNEEKETFELTTGSTEDYQKRLSAVSGSSPGLELPIDINTPTKVAAQQWAEIVFEAFLKKAQYLAQGRFDLDHLLIYDLTGLGLLVRLERGAPILRQKLREWIARERPLHRFRRVSVLRDLALLLDLGGNGEILRGRSPYYRLPVLRARDEEDLMRRERDIDRFCRENSIRHLKAFGSILGDLDDLREDSDLDLLVEFEPGAHVTLLDMARMERELANLTGFSKVDLRTAEDLSRYFRREVLQEAVELDALQR